MIKKNEKDIIISCIEEFEQKTQIELKLVIEPQAYRYWNYILGIALGFNFLFWAVAQAINTDFSFIVLYAESIVVTGLIVIFCYTFMGVRFFVKKQKKMVNVKERALYHFAKEKVYATKMRSGMLLYYSRLERDGVIICDEGVLQKITPEELLNYQNQFVQALNSKKFAAELGAFIRVFGVFCHQKWPDETFENELCNEVMGH